MKEAARLPCCQRVRRGACRSLARDDRRARDADNSRSVPLALPSALSSCLSVALLTPPHPALMVLPFSRIHTRVKGYWSVDIDVSQGCCLLSITICDPQSHRCAVRIACARARPFLLYPPGSRSSHPQAHQDAFDVFVVLKKARAAIASVIRLGRRTNDNSVDIKASQRGRCRSPSAGSVRTPRVTWIER